MNRRHFLLSVPAFTILKPVENRLYIKIWDDQEGAELQGNSELMIDFLLLFNKILTELTKGTERVHFGKRTDSYYRMFVLLPDGETMSAMYKAAENTKNCYFL